MEIECDGVYCVKFPNKCWGKSKLLEKQSLQCPEMSVGRPSRSSRRAGHWRLVCVSEAGIWIEAAVICLLCLN